MKKEEFENFVVSLQKTAAIPIMDAAEFFHGIKQFDPQGVTKTAGWEDAPDETGALEGQFAAPLEQVVAKMGVTANLALRLANASHIYEDSVRGPMAKDIKCGLSNCAWDMKGLSSMLIRRMSTLAGPPHIADIESPPASTDPTSVAKRIIRALQELMECLAQLKCMCGANPMVSRLTNFEQSCQENIDNFWRLLDPAAGDLPAQGVLTAIDNAAAAMEAPEELPEEEVAEAAEEEAVPEKVAAVPQSPEEFNAAVAEQALKGRLSAVQGASRAEAMAQHQRGERAGEVGGKALGVLGGGALGRKLIGGPTGTLGGAALGYMLGGKAGKELGTEVDMRRDKTASISALAKRMVATVKLAQEPIADAEAPMTSPTDTAQLQPTNYLLAEQMGQQAQNQNEAAFHKQRADKAMQEAAATVQAAQQQMQQMQMEMQQLQQQQAQVQESVQGALSEATQARDEALAQTQNAANMRMGMQRLRQQMVELASQDPAAIAAAELDNTFNQTKEQVAMQAQQEQEQQMMAEQEQQAMAQQEQAAMQQQQQAQQPQPQPAQPQGGAPKQASVKVAGPLGLGVGATLGAVKGLHSSATLPGKKNQLASAISTAEQQQTGTYRQAAELAKLKHMSVEADLASAHPKRHALKSSLRGALSGAMQGNVIENAGRAGANASSVLNYQRNMNKLVS